MINGPTTPPNTIICSKEKFYTLNAPLSNIVIPFLEVVPDSPFFLLLLSQQFPLPITYIYSCLMFFSIYIPSQWKRDSHFQVLMVHQETYSFYFRLQKMITHPMYFIALFGQGSTNKDFFCCMLLHPPPPPMFFYLLSCSKPLWNIVDPKSLNLRKRRLCYKCLDDLEQWF